MNIEWTNSSEHVDWHELSELYRIAPLSPKEPDALKLVFGNSMFKLFAYDEGRLIAAGRALADGADCSYICDVAVHPDYQGMGLGKAIVQQLVASSQGHKKIILYAAVGKEGFYRKLGFKRMTTAMAIFADQAESVKKGLLVDNE